jgi:hypothetical protein
MNNASRYKSTNLSSSNSSKLKAPVPGSLDKKGEEGAIITYAKGLLPPFLSNEPGPVFRSIS